jgi:hypothetical protein
MRLATERNDRKISGSGSADSPATGKLAAASR